MAKIVGYLWNVILIAVGAAIARELAALLGVWIGLAAWAGGIGVACILAAWLLHKSPMGKVTWRNRFAGYLLPWGYRIGGGKLVPLVAAAWFVWVCIGGATALLGQYGPAHWAAALGLFWAWMLYGALCLRQIDFMLNRFRNSPRPRRTMLVVTVIMLAVMGGSLYFWLMGLVWQSLLLALGPIVVLGGGYGLFIAVFLVAGRNANWR